MAPSGASTTMFDSLAQSVSKTAGAVFGGLYKVVRPNEFQYEDVTLVVRKDQELLDDQGQAVGRTIVIRIPHKGLLFTPQRGDVVSNDCGNYTLGRRIADDGNAYEFEATT